MPECQFVFTTYTIQLGEMEISSGVECLAPCRLVKVFVGIRVFSHPLLAQSQVIVPFPIPWFGVIVGDPSDSCFQMVFRKVEDPLPEVSEAHGNIDPVIPGIPSQCLLVIGLRFEGGIVKLFQPQSGHIEFFHRSNFFRRPGRYRYFRNRQIFLFHRPVAYKLNPL